MKKEKLNYICYFGKRAWHQDISYWEVRWCRARITLGGIFGQQLQDEFLF